MIARAKMEDLGDVYEELLSGAPIEPFTGGEMIRKSLCEDFAQGVIFLSRDADGKVLGAALCNPVSGRLTATVHTADLTVARQLLSKVSAYALSEQVPVISLCFDSKSSVVREAAEAIDFTEVYTCFMKKRIKDPVEE